MHRKPDANQSGAQSSAFSVEQIRGLLQERSECDVKECRSGRLINKFFTRDKFALSACQPRFDVEMRIPDSVVSGITPFQSVMT
jgi:hypothetical protein